MSNYRCFRFGLCLVAALTAYDTFAFAVDDSVKGAARDLSNQGKDDFDAGRFDAAAQKFQKAFEAVKVPTLALWSARAEARLGRLVAASEHYRQASQLAPNELWVGDSQQEAQAEAAQELEALLPRIPKLRITIVGGQPNEVTMTVDNVPLPSALAGVDRPTDPGQRRVIGKRGPETADVVVELRERDVKEVVLKFSGAPLVVPVPAATATPAAANQPVALAMAPAAAPPSDGGSQVGSTQRTLGWIGLGVGAAGIIEGAVTGIFVIQRYSKLKDGCPNGVCDPTQIDSYRMDIYNTLRTASMVGFIVGGVGLAAGTTLLLTSPTPSTKVGLFVGPGTASVHGVF
jgi:hypothetical protein